MKDVHITEASLHVIAGKAGLLGVFGHTYQPPHASSASACLRAVTGCRLRATQQWACRQMEAVCALCADASARRVLHVQSVSAWAPSCIGPYAQAASLSPPGLALLAGQIGLDPGSMRLVPGPAQAARCLASCAAVAVAVRADLARGLLGCTVYCAGAREDKNTGGRQPDGELAESGWWQLEEAARLLRGMLDGHACPAGSAGGAADDGAGGGRPGESSGGPSVPDGAGCGGEEYKADEDDDGEGKEEEEEEEEGTLDEYLRPPAMPPRRWEPALTYVVVPALPRGAAVELQPLACSLASADAGAVPGRGIKICGCRAFKVFGVGFRVYGSVGLGFCFTPPPAQQTHVRAAGMMVRLMAVSVSTCRSFSSCSSLAPARACWMHNAAAMLPRP